MSRQRGTARLDNRDFAELLQARLNSDGAPAATAHKPANERELENNIARLKAALMSAKAQSKQWRHETRIAKRRAQGLEAHIITLRAALHKAESFAKQRQQDAESAAKRHDEFVAELFKVTCELVEMSKRMAEQSALTETLRAQLDNHRSREWWWQHGVG
jgi:DNA repair exonuclease SbcCD ATPase subunit